MSGAVRGTEAKGWLGRALGSEWSKPADSELDDRLAEVSTELHELEAAARALDCHPAGDHIRNALAELGKAQLALEESGD
jgi:hypothetical protein